MLSKPEDIALQYLERKYTNRAASAAMYWAIVAGLVGFLLGYCVSQIGMM